MIYKRKISYFAALIILAVTIFIISSNKSGNSMDPEIYKNIALIRQKNIYFGHQSVGENIIDGIKKIILDGKQNEVLIKDYNNHGPFERTYFLHSKIGQNGYPQSKFNEFADIIHDLAKKNLNIAMMKLCFVDITKTTNIDEVFKSYVNLIETLQHQYPEIKFIHFTVPLKSEPSWINKLKDKIKGNYNYDPRDNEARNNYNELLLSKYPPKDIFDLAGVESTYPDSKREVMIIDGKPCYSLIKEYTTDGGHLNDMGKDIVSEKLIQKLYEIIKTSDTELGNK